MTIETECPKCGKTYRIKDEMAGRRFRCKDCQSAVSIPDVDEVVDLDSQTADSGDDWDQDFMGGLDSALKSDGRKSAAPPPTTSRQKHRGSKKDSPKKKRSSEGGGAASAMKLVGALIGGVLGFVVAYFVVTTLMESAQGSAATWEPFSPPGGSYQVEMPSTPQTRTAPGAAPGATSHFGEAGNFACAVSEQPLPFDTDGLSTQQLMDKVADHLAAKKPRAKISPPRPMSFGKFPAMEVDLSVQSQDRTLKNISRIVIAGDKMLSLEFVTSAAAGGAERDRFFNSFKLLDAGRKPLPATWGTGASPAPAAAMMRLIRPTQISDQRPSHSIFITDVKPGGKIMSPDTPFVRAKFQHGDTEVTRRAAETVTRGSKRVTRSPRLSAVLRATSASPC